MRLKVSPTEVQRAIILKLVGSGVGLCMSNVGDRAAGWDRARQKGFN